MPFLEKLKGFLHRIVQEVKAPTTVGMIAGFIFGATPRLISLIVGATASLQVVQDSIKLLGDGTLPCITLLLGGNLYQGLSAGRLKASLVIGVTIVRYVILPLIGLAVVKAAGDLGFLSPDPLYRCVLMIQFTVPPAVSIGTMTQLYDVGQDECSVIFLWTYLIAAVAITVRLTFFMWILS